MTDPIDFEKERERRLTGKCKSDKELEDDKKKQRESRKLADRRASNARIIAELSRAKGPGGSAG